jgi:hypothetical protein
MTWIEAPAMPVNGHSPPSAVTAPVVDSTGPGYRDDTKTNVCWRCKQFSRNNGHVA